MLTLCKLKGTLQKAGNKYYRIRHYDEIDKNGKLGFHSHQISKDYAEKQLEKLGPNLKRTQSLTKIKLTKVLSLTANLKNQALFNKMQAVVVQFG